MLPGWQKKKKQNKGSWEKEGLEASEAPIRGENRMKGGGKTELVR